MATFLKLNPNFTVFGVQPFNEARSHTFGLNGRLAGFKPTGNGGDIGTPGLYFSSGTTYSVNVTLSPDAADEAVGTSPAKSYSLANGLLVEASGTVSVIAAKTLSGAPNQSNPIVIFISYDSDPDTVPTFDIDLKSNVNLSPGGKAILAHFDLVAADWIAEDQVSIKGLFDAVKTITQSHGGFTTRKSDSVNVTVSPGTMITSFGRILNNSTQQKSIPLPLTAFYYRHDLIVIEDQQIDGGDAVISVIAGVETASATPDVAKITSNFQIPIASVVTSQASGIVTVYDRKPDLAWQTDVPSNKDPNFTGSASIADSQPSLVLNAGGGSNLGEWAVAVFKTEDSTATQESKIVIGKIKPKSSFTTPSVPNGPSTPTITTDDYLIKKLTRILDNTSLADVTNDVSYGPPGGSTGPQLSHLSGKFYKGSFAEAMTNPFSARSFTIEYQSIDPLIAFSADGTRIDKLGLDFYDHISVAKDDAHTADNISYLNVNQILSLPNGTHPVQAAIDAVAEKAFGTALPGQTTPTSIPSTFFLPFGIGELVNTYTTVIPPTNKVALSPFNAGNNSPNPVDLGKAPFYAVPKPLTASNLSTSIAIRMVSYTTAVTPTTFLGTTAKIKVYLDTGATPNVIFEQTVQDLTLTTEASGGGGTIINLRGFGSVAMSPAQTLPAGASLQMTIEFPNGVVLATGSFVKTSVATLPSQSFLNVNCVLTVTAS